MKPMDDEGTAMPPIAAVKQGEDDFTTLEHGRFAPSRKNTSNPSPACTSAFEEDALLVQQQQQQKQHYPFPSERSLGSQQYYVYGDGNDSAEAYSAISVTSALVFGFAVTTFVTVEAGTVFTKAHKTGHIVFDIIMALTISLSAFGVVVMNLQYYQVRRMRVIQPHMLRQFLKETFIYRHVARGTTWMALALYLAGLLVLSAVIWQTEVAVAVVLSVILGVGALAVMAVWLKLNDKYMIASGKRAHQRQIKARRLAKSRQKQDPQQPTDATIRTTNKADDSKQTQ